MQCYVSATVLVLSDREDLNCFLSLLKAYNESNSAAIES